MWWEGCGTSYYLRQHFILSDKSSWYSTSAHKLATGRRMQGALKEIQAKVEILVEAMLL
jgi:hypothetical protein